MMGYIWGAMILAGTVYGMATGRGEAISAAVMESASASCALCLGMMGGYILWMGIMNIAEKSGLAQKLSRMLRRPLGAIFRGMKDKTEAMGYVAMNIAANMLGMGNAATPYGLKAMAEMQKHNPNPQSPTDDMCMFLLLNTASVQLLPMTVIILRTSAGSSDPWWIILPTLIVTLLTAALGVAGGLIFRRKK